MSHGFLRALRGEFYLLRHRRSPRWMHLLAFLAAVLYVLGSRLSLGILEAAGGGGPGEVGAWNFWPQFGSATRGGLFVVEIAILLLVAGGLPREAASGAVRDPLSRGLSRTQLLLARAVVALVMPVTLFLAALAGAALSASLLFDAGDIMVGGEVLFAIDEEGIDRLLYHAMLHALPALWALALVALALSTVFRHGVAAVGVGLAVMLSPTLLHGTLGEKAPWFFADVLPAMGPDSFLKEASDRAAGFSDAYPTSFDAIVHAGWLSPWPVMVVAGIWAVLQFRRKKV